MARRGYVHAVQGTNLLRPHPQVKGPLPKKAQGKAPRPSPAAEREGDGAAGQLQRQGAPGPSPRTTAQLGSPVVSSLLGCGGGALLNHRCESFCHPAGLQPGATLLSHTWPVLHHKGPCPHSCGHHNLHIHTPSPITPTASPTPCTETPFGHPTDPKGAQPPGG